MNGHDFDTSSKDENSSEGSLSGGGPSGAETVYAPRTAPKGFFPGVRGALALLGILLFLNVIASIVMMIASGGQGTELSPQALLAAYVFAFGATLSFGVAISRSSFREALPLKGFPRSVIVPLLSTLFGLWVVIIEILAFVTRVVPVDPEMAEEMSRLIFDSVWIGVLLLAVAAPVLEEALFRGIILRGFLGRYEPRKAVLLGAAFFAVAHFNIWQVPASFGTGIFLGWVYYRTCSLPLCMMLHAFHNLVLAFVGEYLANLLGVSVDETVVPFVPWWIVAVGIVLLVVGISLAEKRFRLIQTGRSLKSPNHGGHI